MGLTDLHAVVGRSIHISCLPESGSLRLASYSSMLIFGPSGTVDSSACSSGQT